MEEGLEVCEGERSRVGSCNFCCRNHNMVYRLKGKSEMRNMEVLMCQKCMDELHAQTPAPRKRRRKRDDG